MSSPPPPTISGMADPTTAGAPSQQLAISNGVLLAAVIFLFMVVLFVFLLYLYAKRFLGVNPMLHGPSSTPSSRFHFVGADSPFPRRGLPASVLRSLPVAVFAAGAKTPGGSGKTDALECAVCLSEVADGEKVRTLPKCDHRFHLDCIDMWFHSHDTCPLCRAPVGADAAAEGLPRVPREDPATVEFPMFPTNVLFWGTHDDVANTGLGMPPPAPNAAASTRSSSGSTRRMDSLVIDIPTRAMAVGASSPPLPPSRMPGSAADDLRSPLSARLRSLRRLLSRGKQAVVGSSASSPRVGGGDVEQGLAARLPKTPKTPPSSN